MVDNAEWLLALNYVDFLREVGRHISVNQMIQRESVKLRLEREHHLSFLEFNYMVLQAYDFVELYRRYGCRLQLGGSDQWGNIISGIDLGRKLADVELFAVTSPLITLSSGAKMGKTASGAIWLNADMVSPYEYWQFWRNTDDADVGRFLKLFTELPLDEVGRLEALGGAEINEAKKVLATEATALLHGRAAAAEAAEAARKTFEEGALADQLPTITVPRSDVDQGIAVTALFVRAGLAASNGEVRRAIANNAISVNDERITDPLSVITQAHFRDGVSKLSLGRKKHVLARQA
jgi:tyrosyl-tRNA synthetase